jgi:hypothetical protein
MRSGTAAKQGPAATIMASATWPACRPKNGVTRGFMPKLRRVWRATKVTSFL